MHILRRRSVTQPKSRDHPLITKRGTVNIVELLCYSEKLIRLLPETGSVLSGALQGLLMLLMDAPLLGSQLIEPKVVNESEQKEKHRVSCPLPSPPSLLHTVHEPPPHGRNDRQSPSPGDPEGRAGRGRENAAGGDPGWCRRVEARMCGPRGGAG